MTENFSSAEAESNEADMLELLHALRGVDPKLGKNFVDTLSITQQNLLRKVMADEVVKENLQHRINKEFFEAEYPEVATLLLDEAKCNDAED